jgi:hypothetical protein
LDARLEECKGDPKAALVRLSDDEVRSLDLELKRAFAPTPEGKRYFLENYFTINTKGEEWQGQRLQTVYPFTETQELLWQEFLVPWLAGRPLWFILLKARQLGWSTIVQGLIFLCTISHKLTNSLVIADELKRSNKIFDMSLLAYNYLPWWMRPEIASQDKGEGVLKFNRRDKDEQLRNPGLNSAFYVDAANKPSGSSRGFTLHNFHCTEFGVWNHPEILTSDIIPATPKKNPNVIAIVEGTAKGSGEKYAFMRMWKAAMDGRGLFRPVFAAWWKEKSYCKPFPSALDESHFNFTKEETELAAKVKDEYGHEITKEQMAWRRDQAEQFEATEGDSEKVEQEYPSYARAAFRSGGICAFSLKKLAQIEVSDVRLPIWAGDLVFSSDGKPKLIVYFSRRRGQKGELTNEERSMLTQAPLWIWEWPTTKEIYYEATDPCRGIPGMDYAGLEVFRVPRRKGERIRQCVEYRGYADPKELAKIACCIGHMYNTCEMSPESNNLTEHIGNIIHVHKYPKLYRWRRQDKTPDKMLTNFWGWDSGTHKARTDLQVRFNSLLADDSIEIRSSRLLAECQSFIKADDSDRFEASAGEHDDILFATMICVYCLMELDPRLFRMVEEEPPPDDGRGAHNTDFSLFDEQEKNLQTQFNML